MRFSMGASKLATLFIFFALIFCKIRADASIDEVDQPQAVVLSESSESEALKIELALLQEKIQTLETHIDERSKELKSKDEIIAQKEKIVQEKSNSITQLQNEIVSLQKKGTSDAEEQLGKAYARASELEKQVDKLKKEIETQQKEKAALESRANEAERKTRELNSKVESLKKITDEQKTRIRKTERALQVAEEEMMKAKFDANSKTKELMEVHGAWLPPWFANHLISCQSFMEVHWNKHGKPALDTLTQKALEKKAQAQKWSEPHVETFKTKWIPAIKDQWLEITTYLEPHVQLLCTKTVEAYEASKNAITPHVIKVQEFGDPYFQEAKKVSKPYIDQVAAVTKPHVDNVKVALKPYTKKVVRGYGKFLKSATTYHQKVQDTVQEKLKNHELTKPLATKELVWFAASALLALPIIFLFRICSAIFCKKAKKPVRNGHTNHHSRRKAKRGHPDK